MNQLDKLSFMNFDNTEIKDYSKYRKINELRTMSLTQDALANITAPLLSQREDPKQYSKTHRMQLKFRSTQQWIPSQSVNPDLSYQVDAISLFESSKVIEQTRTLEQPNMNKILDDSITQPVNNRRILALKKFKVQTEDPQRIKLESSLDHSKRQI